MRHCHPVLNSQTNVSATPAPRPWIGVEKEEVARGEGVSARERQADTEEDTFCVEGVTRKKHCTGGPGSQLLLMMGLGCLRTKFLEKFHQLGAKFES